MERGLQRYNRQEKLSLWGERIRVCRSSGQTVQQWCADNGVSTGSYYKWQRLIFELASAEREPRFVELDNGTPRSRRGDAVAVLHFGGAEVGLTPGIDEDTLTTICRGLGKC